MEDPEKKLNEKNKCDHTLLVIVCVLAIIVSILFATALHFKQIEINKLTDLNVLQNDNLELQYKLINTQQDTIRELYGYKKIDIGNGLTTWIETTPPTYYITAEEIYNVAEKDEYNQSMFWIEDYTKKIVWILLPNSEGHLRAYVEDIQNLQTSYTYITDFEPKDNFTWTADNNSIFID